LSNGPSDLGTNSALLNAIDGRHVQSFFGSMCRHIDDWLRPAVSDFHIRVWLMMSLLSVACRVYQGLLLQLLLGRLREHRLLIRLLDWGCCWAAGTTAGTAA
jgi:hypothetical protein